MKYVAVISISVTGETRDVRHLVQRHWDHVPHVSELRAYTRENLFPHLRDVAEVTADIYELRADGTMKNVRTKGVFTRVCFLENTGS